MAKVIFAVLALAVIAGCSSGGTTAAPTAGRSSLAPIVAARYSDACKAWHDFEDFEKMKPPAFQYATQSLLTAMENAGGAGGSLAPDYTAFQSKLMTGSPEWVVKGDLDHPEIKAIDADCAGH